MHRHFGLGKEFIALLLYRENAHLVVTVLVVIWSIDINVVVIIYEREPVLDCLYNDLTVTQRKPLTVLSELRVTSLIHLGSFPLVRYWI